MKVFSKVSNALPFFTVGNGQDIAYPNSYGGKYSLRKYGFIIYIYIYNMNKQSDQIININIYIVLVHDNNLICDVIMLLDLVVDVF